MHLKLSVNSTRKAKWFAKLGFLNPQRALTIKLATIKQNSIVGAIDVIVERIYPLSYIETCPDGSKIYRNQKQEEFYSLNLHKKAFLDEGDHEMKDEILKNKNNDNKLQTKRNVSEFLKIRVVDSSISSKTS
jgi:hypothetical protein